MLCGHEAARAVLCSAPRKFVARPKRSGKGTVYWADAVESYNGFAYNKDKLPATAVPKIMTPFKSGAQGKMAS